MGSEVVVVPIIFLTIAAISISYFYLRYRERSTIIEKGLTPDQMLALYDKKKDPLLMLKIGVVVFFFGLGLGIGMLIEEANGNDAWIPFLLFTSTGLGFIVAFYLSKRFEKTEKLNS